MGINFPILYEENETTFGEHNGIGVLSDCIECNVIETLNEEFELVLKYPSNGVLFNELIVERIIYAKPSPHRDPEPFRIYQNNKTIREAVEFSARHITYDLAGMIFKPIVTSSGTTVTVTKIYNPADMFAYLCDSNRYYPGANAIENGFWFETDLYDDYNPMQTYNKNDYVLYSAKIYKAKEDEITGTWNSSKWDLIDNYMAIDKPYSVRSLFGTGTNTLLGSYGGEFQYTGYTVSLLQHRGMDRGVSLRYGINLIDATQEKNIAEMYTGVLPFAVKNGLTTVINASSPVISIVETPSRPNVLALDVSSDIDGTVSAALVEQVGRKYIAINEYDKPKVSISLRQADLINLESPSDVIVELGDTIHVYYEKLGINVNSEVVSTDYNVLTGRYNEIEIGDVKNTIVRTIAKQTNQIYNITNNNYYYPGGGSGGGSSATAVFG